MYPVYDKHNNFYIYLLKFKGTTYIHTIDENRFKEILFLYILISFDFP